MCVFGFYRIAIVFKIILFYKEYFESFVQVAILSVFTVLKLYYNCSLDCMMLVNTVLWRNYMILHFQLVTLCIQSK